jgi:hypothetical protein
VEFRIAWLCDVAASSTDKFAVRVRHHAAESVGRDAVGATDFGVRFHHFAVRFIREAV